MTDDISHENVARDSIPLVGERREPRADQFGRGMPAGTGDRLGCGDWKRSARTPRVGLIVFRHLWERWASVKKPGQPFSQDAYAAAGVCPREPHPWNDV